MTFPFAMTICAFLLRSPPWHQPTIVRKHTLCIVDQTIKVLGFIHAPPRADRSGRVSSHQTKADSTHFLLFPRFSRFCAFNTVGGWMAGGRKRSSQQFTQQMKSMVFVSNPIRFPELSRGDILLRHLISRHRKCCGGYLTLHSPEDEKKILNEMNKVVVGAALNLTIKRRWSGGLGWDFAMDLHKYDIFPRTAMIMVMAVGF